MHIDNLTLKGSLRMVLRDANGEVKDERFIDNLVVTVGKSHVTSRMIGVTQNIMSHMSVGTNNTAAAAGDTTLGTELAKVAFDATQTQTTTTTTDDSVTHVATFPAGTGTGALVEAGIFNAAGANTGVMLCRTVFSVINKGASDSLTITWKVVLA